ncbi:hypothetical protein GCM10011529_31240 [Polymorphobacter glacialis]|uniref:Uncharacterized protein n=1 Tax=Sandarakinorhabdus glacialis TaxID=1614636 RepID=A0A917A2Q3_9SPHN|nr:hypothetical protein [Polymorphobacter glacialis]GGE22390.1 hypothetical protein GCM10011529_31240 [Polymorphobacter glacialis]
MTSSSDISDAPGPSAFQSAGRLGFMKGARSKSVVPANIKEFARDEIHAIFGMTLEKRGAGQDGINDCNSAQK